MKLLIISIIQSCNQSCDYCPTRRWLYPPDFRFEPNKTDSVEFSYFPTELEIEKGVPVNAIKNKYLLKWLDKFIDPNEWDIEITGGEPGLYPEINTLIPELNKRGYKGVIKTNGSLPVPKTGNFIRTTAWHKDIKEIPKYYDKILIIKNPHDNWRSKEEYCKEHDIPYRLLYFNYDNDNITGKKKMPEPKQNTVYEGSCLILSMGQIIPCYPVPPENNINIFNMSPPAVKDIKNICPKCVHCLSAESDIYNSGGISVEGETRKIKDIKCFAYMNSVGQFTSCSPKPVKKDKHIFNMSQPRILKKICPTCINVIGFEWAYEYISKIRQG